MFLVGARRGFQNSLADDMDQRSGRRAGERRAGRKAKNRPATNLAGRRGKNYFINNICRARLIAVVMRRW
jgi:hypothetical protein